MDSEIFNGTMHTDETDPKRTRPRKDAMVVGTWFKVSFTKLVASKGEVRFHPRDIGWTHRRPDTKALPGWSVVPRFA